MAGAQHECAPNFFCLLWPCMKQKTSNPPVIMKKSTNAYEWYQKLKFHVALSLVPIKNRYIFQQVKRLRSKTSHWMQQLSTTTSGTINQLSNNKNGTSTKRLKARHTSIIHFATINVWTMQEDIKLRKGDKATTDLKIYILAPKEMWSYDD